MNKKNLEILPIEQWRILRVIKVVGPEWCKCHGLFPYIRTIDETKPLDHLILDDLDNQLLEVINQGFPGSENYQNFLIYCKDQLEDILKTINRPTDLDITIQFTPELPNEISPAIKNLELFAYPRNFKIRLALSSLNANADFLNKFYLCTLPNENLKTLVKTIQSV